MNPKTEGLMGLAEFLVGSAIKNGADEAEVSIHFDRGFSVDVRQGEIEKLEEAGDKEMSIRLIKDKKTATIDSSDFSKPVLEQLIKNAISRAEASSPDPFAGLPEFDSSIKLVDWQELAIFDETIEGLTPEQKIDYARQIEAICLSDKRISNSHGASFSNFTSETILVNSFGFSGCYQRTGCEAGVHLQAGDGDNKVEDGWYESSRFFKNLWSPEKIAATAIQRVTRLINPRKVKTQNVPVVLEPNIARSLLGFFYQCINGEAIYMKQSFLVNKINEKIAGEGITIVDDGLIPGAPGSKPFDGEGVPIRKTVVVEKGILKTYLTDAYSARKLNRKSTGNASGGNNFHLQPGSYSPQEIIKSVDKGLLLTGTLGQGTNPATGDFSRGAIGLWIENGVVTFPVAEITVSGNLSQMLKNIEMIGNDLRFTRSLAGPTIKIGEMTVSGV